MDGSGSAAAKAKGSLGGSVRASGAQTMGTNGFFMSGASVSKADGAGLVGLGFRHASLAVRAGLLAFDVAGSETAGAFPGFVNGTHSAAAADFTAVFYERLAGSKAMVAGLAHRLHQASRAVAAFANGIAAAGPARPVAMETAVASSRQMSRSAAGLAGGAAGRERLDRSPSNAGRATLP